MATAFAIYCADDNSLMFYKRDEVPSVGSTFNNKIVTEIYTGFEDRGEILAADSILWKAYRESIIVVNFIDKISPICTKFWFYNFKNLTFINIQNLDTSKVTNMYGMFKSCSSLTFLNVSSFDTSNVTDMHSMFENCNNLTSLNISNFNTSNVTNMDYMFYLCKKLTTIYVSNLWHINAVANSTNMFGECTSLIGAVPFDGNKSNAMMANYETGYLTLEPEDMLIKYGTLYNFANKIRILSGIEGPMTPAEMVEALNISNAEELSF